MESPDRPADPSSRSGPPPATAPVSVDQRRAVRLKAIREQIAAGTYDTPDRFDAALDGLLADLLD